MQLKSLFLDRRSEPKILLVLKLVTMLMIISYLVSYTAIIIIDVKQDAPIIRTTINYADTIRVPDIVFNCHYKFQIICKEGYYKLNDTSTTIKDCAPGDLIQPDEKDGPVESLSLYWGAYQSSRAFTFKAIPDDNIPLLMVALTVQIIDSNYTSDNNNPIPTLIEAWAFDPDYDTLTNYIKEKRFDELSSYSTPTPSPYESLVGSNLYILSLNQEYQFHYSSKIREFIKKSWKNDFGFPPDYEAKPYIESTLYPGPLNPLSNFENSSMFFITMPMNNAVQVDREIRSNTYLGGLGLLGGAWTLAGALYTFLFGADMLNPWGVVQSYCFGISRRTRNQLKEAYKKQIPFFDTSKLDTKNNPSMHTLSLAEQNELLLARIDSLELLLQEYVVDVSYLDKVRRDKEIKTFNAVSDSTRNSAANTTDINSMSSTASNTALNLTQNSTNSNEGLV